VKSPPWGALVEKQVVLHTGRILARDEDDEDTGDERTWTHPLSLNDILGETPEAALTVIPCRTIGSLSGDN
jgi:hypothetical protein